MEIRVVVVYLNLSNCFELLDWSSVFCRDLAESTRFEQCDLFAINISHPKGPFINHVDRILRIFDPISPFLDKFTSYILHNLR